MSYYNLKVNPSPLLETINRQHNEFMEIINALYTSIMTGKQTAGVMHTLSFLIDYTYSHLLTEESIMNNIDYPNKGHHIAEHDSLRKYIKSYDSPAITGEKDSSLGLLLYMKNWFVAHIRFTDAELIDYYIRFSTNSLPVVCQNIKQ